MALLYASVLSAQINSTTAVVPFGANPSYGNGIMPDAGTLPSGGTYGKSQDAADAYNEWKSNYTEACGAGQYRVKFDEPNRTVSEGIGYGMQLAAYAADKTLFDGLYTYWKNFKSPASSGKNGKLMNWRIDGCSGVSGTGSAADADVDAAWALLIAENQWPTATTPFDYASEATNMLYSIKELELNSSGQLINGDGWGFGDNCRNPSYQSPAYYRFFKTSNSAYASDWNNAINGAYTLINANADGSTGLISDWSNPSGNRNTCNPGGLGYAATDGYGYDACRNPWRMAQDVIWNNDAQAKAICTKLAAYINSKGAGGVGGPLYQNGGNYSGFSHNATFVSTFAMAVMGSTNQTLMNAMYVQTKNTKDVIKNSTLSGYFGNTLRCVSLFMMTGNYWKPGTSSLQEINVRNGVFSIESASTYDFQNQQIAPTGTGKAVTFTIENLGFATLNLTGTPKVTVSGTDATMFTVTTQPSVGNLTLAATTTFVVTFNPTSLGTKTAKLTIASNDPDENPYTINVTGIGTANATAPKMTVYDTINILTSNSNFPLGTFTSGAAGYKILKITNTGDAPLTISGAVFSIPVFSLLATTLPKVIAIGQTGYLSVGFNAPATAGISNGTITLTTTDPNAPSFILNLTATSAACSANPLNRILLDYDGNINLKNAFAPKGTFSQSALNPSVSGLNLSPKVASYVRPLPTTAPVWDGKYDIIRYYNCGTVGTSYVSFNMTAANPTIQISFFSPAVGVPITLSPQKPDGADWAPILSDYSSNITVTTTKANQWEVLTFDMSKIISPTNLTADIKCLDIQVDPLLAYAGSKPAVEDRTFYIDDIKYGVNPCTSDLSGILQDFDTHNNVSLDYAVSSLSAPIANPVSGGLNTSANVGLFTKTINAATYDDGFRYDGCGNKIDLSTKKYISMLVYSPVANASIGINAKVPDGPDADTYPDDAASSTQLTVFANKWHRIYFDLSAVSTANLPNVFAIDINFDPTDLSGVSAPNNKFYFDDIRLESALPCVTGIAATDIMNDFEDNRFLNIAFPGATPVLPAVTYFNTVTANPSAVAPNTSAVVGKFLRGTAATGTSFRFAGCQSKIDLTAGHNIIEIKVYSPNANVPVVMSLKNAAGVSLADVTDTVKLANKWTTLRYDFTKLLNSNTVANIDIVVDPNAIYSGASSTAAARTYHFDDLRYALPSPEINIQALTTPAVTDIPSKNAFNMGAASVGDSTLMDFNIQNNGLQTLTLTGTGIASVVVAGANAADFIVTASPSFSTSIGAFGATGFTVKFKPTTSGPRSASITIKSNDADEATYVIYLTGTATASIIKVLDGATALSPIIVTANTTPILIGTSAIGVNSTPAYTMSVKNTGVAPLKITSVTASTGFTVTALTPTGDIAFGAIATFTIVGKPAVAGPNAGTITIVSNDPLTPSYVVNITVTGAAPIISVKDATPALVLTNNTTPVNVGSAAVGSPATAYTFTIANTGAAPLTVTSITGSTGFAASVITPTGAIAATTGTATFTVIGTPAASGVNTGTITILTNDPVTPSYKVNVTVTGAVPVITVKDATPAVVINNNTAAVNVGSSAVGAPATAYTFTIGNTGLGALTVTSITGSTGFVTSAIIPVGPIAATTGTATFTVTATPAAAGVNTGTITILTNDPATPSYKVNVTVTGTVPTLVVKNGTTPVISPTTPISIGTATVNSAAPAYTSFTINNTGLAPLTLTSINVTTGGTIYTLSALPTLPTTIIAGGTATFTVTGKPAAVGSNPGTITIVTNDPTTALFILNLDVTGIAASTPSLQVKNAAAIVTDNSTAVLVGSAPVGTAAAPFTSFTINNTGSAALSLNSISVSGTVFALTSLPTFPASIAAGANVTFTVTATPSVAGANNGIITIETNDPTTASFSLNVTATGTVAQLQAFDATTQLTSPTAPILIGSALTGSTTSPAYTTLSIKNNGAATLNVSSIVASSGFTLVTSPASVTSIAPNGTVTFTVTATPAAVGANTGTITIASNDPTTASFIINLTATGLLSPQVMVVKDGTTTLATSASPAILVGTAVSTNSAAAYTSLTITNTGGTALGITSITGSAGFAVTTTPAAPTSIAANGTLTLNVIATPASLGANAGTITIVSDDPNALSFVINVTATGTSGPTPVLVVQDGTTQITTNSTGILVGTSAINTPAAPYTTFTINNTGTADLNLTSLAVTSGATVFMLSNLPTMPAVIAAGGSATFTVTATPSAVGTNNLGTITISTDDPTTGSFILNVTATGNPAATSELQVLNGTDIVLTNNAAISLGSAVVNNPGTPYTNFSIKNNGTAPLTLNNITGTSVYVVSAISQTLPATIAAGASVTFTVTGTPTVSGTNANPGTIIIGTTDPTSSFSLNVNMDATTSPAPQLQVLNNATLVNTNNAAISLGSSVINTAGTAYTAFSVKNNGSAPLTLNTITGTSVYVISGISQTLPTTIAAGSSVTYTVTGTPTIVGTNANPGTITIGTDDPTTPSFSLNVTMSATSTPSGIVTIPGVTNNGPVIALGNVPVGTPTPTKTFTINNTGLLPLTIETIVSSNPDFVVTQVTPNPIPAGGSGTFTVIANPSVEGSNTGTITIPSNDPNSPFVINVGATGKPTPTGAVLQVTDMKNQVVANGGTINIGANAANVPTNPYTFIIKNVGTVPLNITGISSLSGFSIVKQIGSTTIAPGATQAFQVVGVPKNPSPTTGAVLITSDDSDTPFLINVEVNIGIPTLGVAKALSSSAIDLYPNPSQGNTNLEFNGTFEKVSVTVYMADGSKVYTTELATMSENSAELPLQELPAGVYIVEVNTAQGKLIKRFIKN